MAPRSRTGCLTCRHRKLKCSEERPICAQCVKANRECIPSSGITFRHQQNPSMNGIAQREGSLERFYGYRETFAKGTVWVAIPQELTFVHTSNPFDEEDGTADSLRDGQHLMSDISPFGPSDNDAIDATLASGLASLAQAGYDAAYATHGLEALSAVASQDYQYARPLDSYSHDASTAQSRPPGSSSYADQHTIQEQDHAADANLAALLSSSEAMTGVSNNIDPRLHEQLANEAKNEESVFKSSTSAQAETQQIYDPSSDAGHLPLEEQDIFAKGDET